jgi:hypothetical protein
VDDRNDECTQLAQLRALVREMRGLARELDRAHPSKRLTGQQVSGLLYALIGQNLSVETRLETRERVSWN